MIINKKYFLILICVILFSHLTPLVFANNQKVHSQKEIEEQLDHYLDEHKFSSNQKCPYGHDLSSQEPNALTEQQKKELEKSIKGLFKDRCKNIAEWPSC